MLYSLFVMIGDGKRSFWCGTEGKYMKKMEEAARHVSRVGLGRAFLFVPHVSRVFILVPPQVLWWTSGEG